MKYQKDSIKLLGVKRIKELMQGFETLKSLLVVTSLSLGLMACGGGGDDTVKNRAIPPTFEFSDTAISSLVPNHVQRFQTTIYNNVLDPHCSNCHKLGGQKSDAPFADRNVNNAYNSATTYFNPSDPAANPANSNLVVRVSNGHNCWSSCAADAATIEAQLAEWARLETEQASSDPQPEETLPVEQTLVDEAYVIPTPGIEFDATVDVPEFSKANGLHELLKEYCSKCHTPNAAAPQQPQAPYFAQDDAVQAYNELVNADKINLNSPAKSQLYVRVAVQQHNCWSNCTTNGNEILALITAWANSRDTAASVDPNLLYSGALKLGEGQITSGGERYDTHVIAKWEFKEGADDDPSNDRVARDTSGIAPFIDLNLNQNVSWVSGYGIEFGPGGKAMSTDQEATQKLSDMIVASREFSVEAWVVPANTSQQNNANNSISSAVIVSYSFGVDQRNFALGQNLYQYEMYTRINDVGSANGDPVFQTPGEVLAATQQHVVMTYSQTNGRRIYVNGNPIVCDSPPVINPPAYESNCPQVTGDMGPITDLSQWNPNFFLTLGAETNDRNPWLGKIRFLAIHNKELTEENIKKNFDAGVGQRFNLLFNLSDIPGINLDGSGSNVPRSYIWFEVSEFDGHSYLFNYPKFINLGFNDAVPPTINFTLKGMRLGVNGRESEVGQAWANLGKSTGSNSDPMLTVNTAGPVSLTQLQGQLDGQSSAGANIVRVPADGTIIPKQNGVTFDQFFLTFEQIGGLNDQVARGTTYGPLPFAYDNNSNITFVVGVRTFDEINATMSTVTGVSRSLVNDDPNVDDDISFDSLKGALPASESVSSFASSQQIAVVSLAGLYCDKLVNNEGNITPATYFGVNASVLSSTPNSTTFTDEITTISTAIVNRMVPNVPTIDRSVIVTELESLAGYLVNNCGPRFDGSSGCGTSARTAAIVKAMCTATLGSAVVTHQ